MDTAGGPEPLEKLKEHANRHDIKESVLAPTRIVDGLCVRPTDFAWRLRQLTHETKDRLHLVGNGRAIDVVDQLLEYRELDAKLGSDMLVSVVAVVAAVEAGAKSNDHFGLCRR